MQAHKRNFFDEVFQVARLIPKGRVTSYGAIARFIGTGISARMVGWALNSAASDSSVPAHRVVNRSGLLTGKHHFKDANEMQGLLESENILVEKEKVVEFNQVFWDPSKELNL